MTPEESDWKQYDMMATTVRSSLDLVLKANIFYYAVTGAILSFYLSRVTQGPWSVKYSLVLPVLMALVLAGLFLRAASTTRKGEAQLIAIASRLGLTAYPDTVGLRGALVGSSVLLIVIACGLTALMIFGTHLGLRG